jgi:hypothetical protein
VLVLTLKKYLEYFYNASIAMATQWARKERQWLTAEAYCKRYYPGPVLQGGMRDSAWFEKIFDGSKTGVKSFMENCENRRF